MKFSVIIPAYNRSIQLMLTLTAFEKQTYPMDRFELIVVNDGSKDDTLEKLRRYQPQAPYPLVVISASETTGRSVARNLGVAAAREDYIIFCDPDFLVSPSFIEVHASYLGKHKNTVVSGVPNLFKNAYTHLHHDYSEAEKNAMEEVLKRSGLWHDHYRHSKETVEIVTQEDIRRGTDKLEKVIAPWDAANPVYRQFATTDVAPWLLAVTRSLSMPRGLFVKVGGFNRKFQKHGLEDWELGYRLHRRGCKFVSMKETIGCHQDHPTAFRNADMESENLRLIYKNHGFRDPELLLFAVCSPSEGLPAYKNALRLLRAWRRSKRASYRTAAKRVTRAFRRSAKLFCRNPDSPVYRRVKARLKRAVIASHRLYERRRSGGAHRRIKRVLSGACRRLP